MPKATHLPVPFGSLVGQVVFLSFLRPLWLDLAIPGQEDGLGLSTDETVEAFSVPIVAFSG